MRRDDFEQLVKSNNERIFKINQTKGHDYAGDEDALANFKEVGEVLSKISIPEFQSWYVYFFKHWAAVRTFLMEGDVKSEPIQGRIDDCILYLHLLSGLIEDRKDLSSGMHLHSGVEFRGDAGQPIRETELMGDNDQPAVDMKQIEDDLTVLFYTIMNRGKIIANDLQSMTERALEDDLPAPAPHSTPAAQHLAHGRQLARKILRQT